MPDGWGERSLEAQGGDAGSPLSLTRTALHLRRELHRDGTLAWDDPVETSLDGEVLLARRAGRFLLAVNQGDAPVPLPAGELLLRSGSGAALGPDEAVWVRL